MAQWVRIVNGELVDVGPLPDSARRLDTLEEVTGLDGPNIGWARAAGWYPAAGLDLTELDLTDEQRDTITAQLAAVLDKRQQRHDVLQRVEQAIGLIRDIGWDQIDRWGDPSLFAGGTIPGSPNAGIEWGGLTTFAKAEALRQMCTLTILWGIRTAEALVLVKQVLADLIDAVDFDPPDPR